MYEEETGFMVSGGSDAKIIVWDLGGQFDRDQWMIRLLPSLTINQTFSIAI